jgi:hypothetical protein
MTIREFNEILRDTHPDYELIVDGWGISELDIEIDHEAQEVEIF